MKKVLSVILVVAVAFCLTACGLDMSKVKGDWTLDTAGGKTVEQLAEAGGLNPAYLAMNATVTDKTFTLTSATGSISYNIQVKADGFECLDASGKIFMSVKYNEDNDTISFKLLASDGNPVEHVMVRGTSEISSNPKIEESSPEIEEGSPEVEEGSPEIVQE